LGGELLWRVRLQRKGAKSLGVLVGGEGGKSRPSWPNHTREIHPVEKGVA